jgi:hypothetical protein
MRIASLALLASLVTVAGCATYETQLQRSEEHFTHDEHEFALANLRQLDADWTSFDVRDQARYCYLRGMTDYRIGFKADARHWLAVAMEIDKDHPGALVPSERSLVNDKLAELNAVVWAGDVLQIEEAPGQHKPKKVETTGAPEDDTSPKPKKKDDDETLPKAAPKP